MRVLVDATSIPANRGGVGRYLDALLPELERLGVDLAVVCQEREHAVTSALVPGSQVIAAPSAVRRRPARLAWEQVGLPALARRLRADVLHCPHYTMPRAATMPVVVTLHDATFFTHPQLHGRLKGPFFRAATRTAVARAAGIVVPSEATRDEVARATRPRDDVVVAYHGVERGVFRAASAAEQAEVSNALGLDGHPYVAFLGTLEPRKNVASLVEGWAAAVADLPDPPALVLAGGRGWDDRIDPAVAAVPAHLRVLRPGYLPLHQLAGFLSGALVVAYPSLGEGFGLPVLEAMACGAAVLTTRELSLPEVGGDAVAYCGTAPDSIRDALGELLGDAPRRQELGQAASVRAASFTWARAARSHVDAYESACRAS